MPSTQASIGAATAAPTAPVALVTGAARRIGREIALALAGAGWNIAVHYGQSENEAQQTVAQIQQLGRQAVAVCCDLANDAAVRGLVARCAALLGPLHCVVNNASLFEEDNAATFDAAPFMRQMQVNTVAPVLLAQALHQQIAEGEQGVVVNLLDQKLFNPNPDYLSYTLSKSALLEATRLLARALAPRLRVVGLAPGITLHSGSQTDAGFQKAHRKTPLGHSSNPADIAQAVVYLVHARSVTGSTLLVDGGQHLVPTERDVMFLTE